MSPLWYPPACIRDLGPVRFERIYNTLHSIQSNEQSHSDADSKIDGRWHRQAEGGPPPPPASLTAIVAAELTRALGQHQVASLHKVLRLLLYEAHDDSTVTEPGVDDDDTGAIAASQP